MIVRELLPNTISNPYFQPFFDFPHIKIDINIITKLKIMNAEELYNYITSKITPEQALKKLLTSTLINYEALKFNSDEEKVHPLILIILATQDLGWNLILKKQEPGEEVEGIIIGSVDYINETASKIYMDDDINNLINPNNNGKL